ncbi:Pimeloyl-ACP methyl ester carboxylesterase [Actinacidiphila alni]|uniref:Pimeloyl-ACP methyl ester carboxylesterase n=1 Tax=Actinacidiphila alni TaxID=380248 RepID=A0A1I2E925_9ACTN|nr:alpha/beta fold hydrolase [Actinacidiphila alni]SFE89345.1 Pimeloyl-ACP methyl ester carboxylesterase [Actinacidiphila alni]
MTNLHLDDGRTLEYVVAGPADGTPLVLHNGTPSAAVLFEPMVATAVRHGLRVVVHSRPGYAGSSPQPGRTVAAVAVDVAAVLDELGADRFLTVGWSGGGPHALACAALLPGRCLAAATVAGVAPHGAEGLDWLGGMGAENIEEFGAAAAGEGPLTAFLNAQVPGLAEVQAGQIAAALGDLVSDVDREALTDEFAEYTAAMFRAAVSSGIAGWRDDDLAFVGDWGFDLGAVEPPVSVWQGAEDRMVPYAHGRWLASRLPGATVQLEPTEGHLSLMLNAFDGIVAELTGHLA